MTNPHDYLLLLLDVELTVVEGKLLTLKDVTVGTSGLTGTRGDDSEKTTRLELLGESLVEGAVLVALGDLGLDRSGLLDLSDLLALLGLTKLDVVVLGIPLFEGSGIDLDNSVLDEGVGTHKLVGGGVVLNLEDTGLAGDSLRDEVEVARVKTHGSVLEVTTTDADTVDTLLTDLGGSGLTAELELSLHSDANATATGGTALVGAVSGDTHIELDVSLKSKGVRFT